MRREEQPLYEPQSNKQRNGSEFKSTDSKILQKQIKTTNQAIQQISYQIKQQHKKVYVTSKEEYNLISANNRNRSNNETIKRSSPCAQKEALGNQITRDQVRMKIILQNSRLKANIEALKVDINNYREQQMKIVEVLRESKTKINQYKDKLKQKSKRITQVTDSNIKLKDKITQLQSKVNQLTSFSEYQTRQIAQLQAQLIKKNNEANEKIYRLQAALRSHEHDIIRYDPIHQTPPISSHSLNEITPYSIKEMTNQQLESIHHYQDHNQENEINDRQLLTNRLMELQHQLDRMRTQNQLKQHSILQGQRQQQLDQKILKDKLQSVIKRQMQLNQQLQQKKLVIQELQQQINSLHENTRATLQSYHRNEQSLKIQIVQCKQMIDKKNKKLAELDQELQSKQKLFEQAQNEINYNYQENARELQQCKQTIEQMTYKLGQYQTEIDQLRSKNEQLLQNQQENEEKCSQAMRIINERRVKDQQIQRLAQELQYEKGLSLKNMQLYQKEIAEYLSQIQKQRREKKALHQDIQRYMLDMQNFKNQIIELNRQKHDNLGSLEQIYNNVIAQHKDESQEMVQSETSKIIVQPEQPKEQKYQQIPFFNSYPIQEPQSLEDEQMIDKFQLQRKNELISRLTQQLREQKRQFQQRLEQQMQKNTIEAVQTNYKLQKEKQEEIQIRLKQTELQFELQQAHNMVMKLKLDLQALEFKEHDLLQQLTLKTQQLQDLKMSIDKKDHLLKMKAQFTEQLQQRLHAQKINNKLLEQQMKKVIQSSLRMKEQLNALTTAKRELTSSLQLQLIQKNQIQNELMDSQKLVEWHIHQKLIKEQLNSELQAFKDMQKEYEQQVKLANEQKGRLEMKLNQALLVNNQHLQMIRSLKEKLQNEQNTLMALDLQKKQLNKQLLSKQSELTKLTRQLSLYETQLKQSEIKLQQSQRLQGKFKGQIQQKMQTLSNIIDEQKNRINKLNLEKAQLINEKEFISDISTKINYDKSSLQRLKAQLQMQLQVQKNSNLRLQEQVSKLNDQFYEQTEQILLLREKIASSEAENTAIKTQREHLKRINEQIKLKLINNQKMIKDLSHNIASLKQSLELSHSDHDQHDLKESKQNDDSISLKLQQIQQSKIGLDGIKQDITQIQVRHKNVIEEYQHKLRSTSVKIEEITQEKQSKIAQLQQLISNLKTQINDLNKGRDTIQATNKQLKQAISDHIGTIQRLQRQLQLEKELISSKDLIIQSFQKSQGLKKGQIDSKDKIIEELQSKLAKVISETQQKRIQVDQLLNTIKRKEQQIMKTSQKYEKDISQLNDDLQISHKMRQEQEEEYGLKINKINKQLTNYKFLLEEAEKQSSFKLEQSNRSIDQIKNELKMFNNTLKQKDQQIKQLKEKGNALREQYEKQKIMCNRFQQERNAWQQQQLQNLNKIAEIVLEINALKSQINHLRATINAQNSELQQNYININNNQLMIKQLKSQLQRYSEQKRRGQAKIEGLRQQKLRLQQKLQQVALQRNKFQTQLQELQQQHKMLRKRKSQQQEQLQISNISNMQNKRSLEQQIEALIKEKQQLMEQSKNIHRQYQTRIQNVCLEQRQILLDVQNKHNTQIQELKNKIINLQQSKAANKNIKQIQKHLNDQIERLEEQNKRILKQFEIERGELTDNVIKLTQNRNQLNEAIQNQRNNIFSKDEQINMQSQLIQRLSFEIAELKSAKGPDSNEAYEYVEKVMQANKQLQNKVESLQLQLREKQKQLNERIERHKQKETRQRNSSGDSWVSRSKIFDQKNLIGELQQTKAKLHQLQAYVVILEEDKSDAEKDKQQVQQLKMKVQSLEAYIVQLQNFDMKSSIRSRQSLSKFRNQEEGQKSSNQDISKKIYLLIDFIDEFSHDKSLQSKLISIRDELDNPALEELISTIFSKLERQALICKNKQRMVLQLQDSVQKLQQKLNESKDNNNIYMKKISILEQYKKKYDQYQQNAQELITSKMILEADLAECRSQIQHLQNKLSKYEMKNRQDHGKKEKQTLEILQEENQSSSDSMMSQSADSEIPSSVNQSKEFKSSVDIRGRGKGQFLSMSKSIMRTKSYNVSEEKVQSSEFLKRCLSCIKQLEGQIQKIQQQLQLKTKLLNLCLNESISKEELINKLSLVESKIKMNDKQLKNYFETSQLEIAALIKNLLRYRQQNDQYGLKNQSHRKVQEYLSLLEQQLTKNGRFYEEETVRISETSRRSQHSSPSRLGSLHEIKQDAVNEDKGSSIVHPRNGQVLRSFSNSEGVTESLDINQIKHNYNQALKELHQTHDQLNSKQQLIRNIHQKYSLVQQEVFLMLEELRIYFEQDQYLFSQVQKIKKYMAKYLQDQSTSSKIKESSQSKIEKGNILVQSNNKNTSIQRRFENPFEKILKLSDNEFHDYSQGLSNECLKQIYTRIDQLMKQRFEDCLDFLNTQRQLIADILKIQDNEGALTGTINILASRLNKQEITDIITNSPNRIEARKTLNQILRQQDAKSMVSDQHDFSPNSDRMKQIRNRVYQRPTQLSLTLHNQLLQILAAPTRNQFYNLIEQFYRIIKDFEQRFQKQLSERQEQSQKHSIRIKKALDGQGHKELDFSIQKMDYLDVKQHKNRSNSCAINVPQSSQYN